MRLLITFASLFLSVVFVQPRGGAPSPKRLAPAAPTA